MPDLSVHEASTVQGLARHATAWDSLALAAPERLPMLSHAWVASYVEHRLARGQGWRCLFAYAGDELVGVLPIITVPRLVPGRRLQAPSDPHTRSGYALLAVGRESETLAVLLSALQRLEPRYLWLRFFGLRGDCALLGLGNQPGVRNIRTQAAGWRAKGSFLKVVGSFDDYEAGLQSNFRRNLRKGSNRCEREHGVVSYQFITGADARSPEPLDRFLELEAAGWKGDVGTAIKCTPRLLDFYTALSRRMSDNGWLEWHFLELDGTPVAGHLAVRFGHSLVLLKIAYDESYARIGPGNLLFRAAAVRAFADEGVDEINCLSDTAWHHNWRMSTADYSDMVVTRRRLLPSFAVLIEVKAMALARDAISRRRAPGLRS